MKMRRLFTSIVIVSIISVFASCNDDSDPQIEIETSGDCVFEQIDEKNDGQIDDIERTIMNFCSDNNFISISEIRNNIIGEWEIIGYGHGWVPTPSQPCAHITVIEEELIFEFTNSSKDTVVTYQWGIEEAFWTSGSKYFRLRTFPDYIEGLYITHFCEKYMYGDGTPSDGNMYLYEKVD